MDKLAQRRNSSRNSRMGADERARSPGGQNLADLFFM